MKRLHNFRLHLYFGRTNLFLAWRNIFKTFYACIYKYIYIYIRRRYNEETKFSVTPSFVLTHSSDSILIYCPMSLKYKARANIKADKDFKTDVKRIRKYSESEYVKALIRFHYRDIDRHRAELHRNKRPSFQNKTSTVSNVKSNSKKGTP